VTRTPATAANARRSYGARLAAAIALRNYPDALHHSFFARASRLLEDDALLAQYDQSVQPITPPSGAVLSVRPAPEAPHVGRLTRDGKVLKAALQAGRAAIERVLEPLNLVGPPS
jgi:hypothetical protein